MEYTDAIETHSDDGASASVGEAPWQTTPTFPSWRDRAANNVGVAAPSQHNTTPPPPAVNVAVMHRTGRCQPCWHYFGTGLCKMGDACHFCHDKAHNGQAVPPRRPRQPSPPRFEPETVRVDTPPAPRRRYANVLGAPGVRPPSTPPPPYHGGGHL